MFAGTLNGPSALEVEATRPFAEYTLQRIHLVEEAHAQKSRAQRFVDRFNDRYSPAVLAAALVVAVIRRFWVATGRSGRGGRSRSSLPQPPASS